MSFPKETGYLVFDAHYDLRDEYADIKLSHACLSKKNCRSNVVQKT